MVLHLPTRKPALVSAPPTGAPAVELSPRQLEVLEMVLDRRSNENIAADLGITPQAVEDHCHALIDHAYARSFPEQANIAHAAKLFAVADPLNFTADTDLPVDLRPLTAAARVMFESAPAAMILIDRGGGIIHLNPAGERLFGYLESDVQGQPIEILVPASMRDQHERMRDGFMQAPVARPMGIGRALVARKSDGSEISVDIGLHPLVEGERPLIVLVSVIDNSDRQRAEHAELLMNEVTHRAKNLLAVVIAVSRQLGKANSDFSSFEEAFEQRLQSFAATYLVLEEGDGSSASVDDLVRSQLALFDGDGTTRFRIEGPKLSLPRHQMEYLGLAIHELATNAIKHGALSAEDGEVSVRWSADDDVFCFDWIERGGPVVPAPKRKGFGSVILERAVPTAFGGAGALRHRAEGIVWHLEAPLPAIDKAR